MNKKNFLAWVCPMQYLRHTKKFLLFVWDSHIIEHSVIFFFSKSGNPFLSREVFWFDLDFTRIPQVAGGDYEGWEGKWRGYCNRLSMKWWWLGSGEQQQRWWEGDRLWIFLERKAMSKLLRLVFEASLYYWTHLYSSCSEPITDQHNGP